jgi:glycosyltransferase involved in cell wall biosynthesis
MTPPRPRLLFVAPRFLFPADSGGKIRTGDVLRGLRGGRFEITLASPAPPDTTPFRADIEAVCDRFVTWPEIRRGRLFEITRMRHLVGRLPVSVASDRSREGRTVVATELRRTPSVVVVDFPHTAVLMPRHPQVPSVLFTHNVEAQIFQRHVEVAANHGMRRLWRNQEAKMARFERETLRCYDTVIAVSASDKRWFETHYGLTRVESIPTGVDLTRFEYDPLDPHKTGPSTFVFTGSMDWLANIDGVEFLMDEIWPLIVQARPEARMLVVGRHPPDRLVAETKRRGLAWEFTGFVDDVREFIRRGDVCVIPLRVGSGTRIKVFEAMAIGRPVVSTPLGVDGLELEAERHYLHGDTPAEFAAACLRLYDDAPLRRQLADRAREHVARNFSSARVAEVFEDICARTCGLA